MATLRFNYFNTWKNTNIINAKDFSFIYLLFFHIGTLKPMLIKFGFPLKNHAYGD